MLKGITTIQLILLIVAIWFGYYGGILEGDKAKLDDGFIGVIGCCFISGCCFIAVAMIEVAKMKSKKN